MLSKTSDKEDIRRNTKSVAKRDHHVGKNNKKVLMILDTSSSSPKLTPNGGDRQKSTKRQNGVENGGDAKRRKVLEDDDDGKGGDNARVSYELIPSPYDGAHLMKKCVANLFKGKKMEVVGGIGSGKSTLCEEIAALFSEYGIAAKYYPEVIARPLFDFMLKNPQGYANQYQDRMQTNRFHTHELAMILHVHDPDTFIITDGGLIVDYTFERYHHKHGNISDEQDQIYRQTIEGKAPALVAPDVILYVKCDIKTSNMRVKKRERAGEDVYTEDFLKELSDITEDLFNQQSFEHLKERVYEWDNNVAHKYFSKRPYYDGEDTTGAKKIKWVEDSRSEASKNVARRQIHANLTQIAEMFFQPSQQRATQHYYALKH